MRSDEEFAKREAYFLGLIQKEIDQWINLQFWCPWDV